MEEKFVENIFKNSSFLILKKDEFLNPEYQAVLSEIKFDKDLSGMHADRLNEYQLSRIGLNLLFKKEFSLEVKSFTSNEDRSPIWPIGFVGSISHCKDLIVVAISKSNDILGIDIENLGRVRPEMDRYILASGDLKECTYLSENELKTIIFCAKEALYKALYPKVLKFFGFDSAIVDSIDVKGQIFNIKLVKALSDDFGPDSKCSFTGRFSLNNTHCLAIIEE